MTTILPAEWAEQDAILLAWPHDNTDWLEWLPEVINVYETLTETISHYQKVVISCDPIIDQTALADRLHKIGANTSNLILTTVPTNDTWARDHGVITVIKDGVITPLDFQFDAWGGKFVANLDNQINQTLVNNKVIQPAQAIDLILEGGSIETDGHGTLLTTQYCLLNDNRNAHLSKEQLSAQLTELFGLQRILWLSRGQLPGDDTDAHIDTLARFCDAHTLCYVSCDDSTHPLYDELSAMKAELERFVDYQGQPYQLLPLPLCSDVRSKAGDLLPASYANFLITNHQVLVPTYGTAEDAIALNILKAQFSDKTVKGIYCRPLIEQFGSLHCITMQLPKGSLRETSL